jgi:hypothetical protein
MSDKWRIANEERRIDLMMHVQQSHKMQYDILKEFIW